MIDFLWKLWPYLAGGLIGWLLAGWFARRLKQSAPPTEKIVEKIVEKQVDNPQHVALISELEIENKEIADLKTQISDFKSTPAKTVDNPAQLKRISELESQVYNYKNSSKPAPQSAVSTTTNTVDNPIHLRRISELESQLNSYKNSNNSTAQPAISVSKKSGKTIDNPIHIKRISELESQLESYKKSTESSTQDPVPTKTVDNPVHIKRISELESQLENHKKSSENSTQDPVPTKTVDNPTHIKRISELETQVQSLQQGPTIDLSAAKAAGFKLKNGSDLTAIEGIGPKINDLIKADGVESFSALAGTPVSSIQTILDNAGPSYKIANPSTWPDQANLAANNRWPALKALQDVLVGGLYPDTSSTSTSSSVKKSAKKTTTSSQTTETKKAAVAKKVTEPKPTATSTSSPVPVPVSTSTSSVDKAAAKAAGFRVKIINGKMTLPLLKELVLK